MQVGGPHWCWNTSSALTIQSLLEVVALDHKTLNGPLLERAAS